MRDHRKLCAKKHEKLLECYPEKPFSQCPTCSLPLREWSLVQPSLFVCHSDQCSEGETKLSDETNTARFTCYFCDVHFCSNCVELAIKVDDTRIDKDKEQSGGGGLTDSREQNIGKIEVKLDSADDGDNQLDLSNTNTAFLFADEDIPLIDDGMSLEDVSIIAERIKANRPKFLNGNNHSGFYFNPLGLDSPDVFKLRAPIVSCENILTPGISTELLLAK